MRAHKAPGRSVAFTQTEGAGLASTAPPPPGSGARPNCRDVIANQIFPQNVDKFVCGRGQPRTSPGGGDSQEGAKRPLLCACRAQRHRFHRPQGGSWRVVVRLSPRRPQKQAVCKSASAGKRAADSAAPTKSVYNSIVPRARNAPLPPPRIDGAPPRCLLAYKNQRRKSF